MGRNLLRISIIFLSLLFTTSPSSATELIQNGGFEAGELGPWVKVGDNNTWTVSEEYVLEGMYSGYVVGADKVRQPFSPRLGSNIEVFSLSVMTAMGGTYVAVEIEYADSSGSTLVNVLVPAAFRWHSFDLLDRIDPDREVSGLVLSGHRSGYLPYHTRTWYDAVTIQNNGPGDIAEEADSFMASSQKVKLKFNLKKLETRLDLKLLAEGVPEGIEAGPVDIRVQFTQDGLTTEFDATAELVEIPNKKDHSIQLKDVDCPEQ